MHQIALIKQYFIKGQFALTFSYFDCLKLISCNRNFPLILVTGSRNFGWFVFGPGARSLRRFEITHRRYHDSRRTYSIPEVGG